MLRVFRLIRALRPLRVINRAPGLKLVVQASCDWSELRQYWSVIGADLCQY